jgi:hypothetical protein
LHARVLLLLMMLLSLLLLLLLSLLLLLLLQEKNSPEGLVGVARRFVKFGGGVSDVQLEWLEQQLQVGLPGCTTCLRKPCVASLLHIWA